MKCGVRCSRHAVLGNRKALDGTAVEPIRVGDLPLIWIAAPLRLCGRNAEQVHERERPLDLAGLKSRLEPLGEVRINEYALRFFIAPYEMTVFSDGRAIIKGTSDASIARSLYAKYVG